MFEGRRREDVGNETTSTPSISCPGPSCDVVRLHMTQHELVGFC